MIDTAFVTKVVCFWSMKEFCEKYAECPFDKRRILIIDNCNLTKQIGYAPTMYGTPKPEATYAFNSKLSTKNALFFFTEAFDCDPAPNKKFFSSTLTEYPIL